MARIDVPLGKGGDAVQIWSLQPELGAAAMNLVDAAYNRSILPVRVREAARMRIAQLNACTVCLAFRADSVTSQGLTEDFYCQVGVPDDGVDFSAQERLAIEYAERFAADHLSIDDAFFGRLRECFTDPEILDLTLCLSAFLGLGRTLRALGITGPRSPTSEDRAVHPVRPDTGPRSAGPTVLMCSRSCRVGEVRSTVLGQGGHAFGEVGPGHHLLQPGSGVVDRRRHVTVEVAIELELRRSQ